MDKKEKEKLEREYVELCFTECEDLLTTFIKGMCRENINTKIPRCSEECLEKMQAGGRKALMQGRKAIAGKSSQNAAKIASRVLANFVDGADVEMKIFLALQKDVVKVLKYRDNWLEGDGGKRLKRVERGKELEKLLWGFDEKTATVADSKA